MKLSNVKSTSHTHTCNQANSQETEQNVNSNTRVRYRRRQTTKSCKYISRSRSSSTAAFGKASRVGVRAPSPHQITNSTLSQCIILRFFICPSFHLSCFVLLCFLFPCALESTTMSRAMVATDGTPRFSATPAGPRDTKRRKGDGLEEFELSDTD